MDMATKREGGYYWVKLKGKFIVAEWLPLCGVWATTEYEDPCKDDEFSIINETKLEPPH